jgi:HD-GYP domain-containing protein (c-di-GMP phosphodiesterase class II)
MMDERSVGHTTRVANLAVTLAKSMGYTDDPFLEAMYKGSFLHDIGKLAIPDKVLNKPGPLNAEEWELMRQHPLVASQMLSAIPILNEAADIPLMHHERWDGKGYPNHLAGEQIPIAVRIFAIVDVYDALTTKRPYKEAISEENSLQIIRSLAGKQFDPVVVEHFTDHFTQIISESEKLHQLSILPKPA